MKMLTLLLFIISMASIYSQEVKLTINKYEYQVDEMIVLTYEVDSLIDSIVVPDYDNFQVLFGSPFKSITSSFINGVKNSSSKIEIVIKPLKSGKLTIESPIFIIDKNKIKAKSVIVNITPDLMEGVLEEFEYKIFIQHSSKPKGTTRIVIHENKGYIEIYNGKDWEFQRRLTTEEIEQLGRIK